MDFHRERSGLAGLWMITKVDWKFPRSWRRGRNWYDWSDQHWTVKRLLNSLYYLSLQLMDGLFCKETFGPGNRLGANYSPVNLFLFFISNFSIFFAFILAESAALKMTSKFRVTDSRASFLYITLWHWDLVFNRQTVKRTVLVSADRQFFWICWVYKLLRNNLVHWWVKTARNIFIFKKWNIWSKLNNRVCSDPIKLSRMLTIVFLCNSLV